MYFHADLDDDPTSIALRYNGAHNTTDRLSQGMDVSRLPLRFERWMLMVLQVLFSTACVLGLVIAEVNDTAGWRERFILLPTSIVYLVMFCTVAARRGIVPSRYITLVLSVAVVLGWQIVVFWELATYGLVDGRYFNLAPWVILSSALFIFFLRSNLSWIFAFVHYIVSALIVTIFLFANDQPLPQFVQGEIYVNYLVAHLVFLTLLMMFTNLRSNFVREQTHSDDLRQLALQDGLTHLPNRRAFRVSFKRAKARQIRHKTPLSVALIDIDRFKRVNDTYGHQVGDDVLVKLSDLLKIFLRGTDEVFRWGGEEFMLLLQETDVKGAKEVAERLRKTIENATIIKNVTITASIGVTEVMLEESEEDAFNRADRALYIAKRDGRNRVELAKSPLAGRPRSPRKSS